jgi:pimeloyl-ACP methyl ester carboxylesterase
MARRTAAAPSAHPHRTRNVGIVGAVVALAAGGAAIGVHVAKTAARRVQAGGYGPAGSTRPAAQLRADDPLGTASHPADRTALVIADDGVLLSVDEIGPADAPLTVVFVHGYSLSMASWAFQRRALATELATANGHRPDARLVFYDQRGHGTSARGDAERSTMEQLGNDLAAVLAARVPRGPIVLVGHSMGGMTVMALAAVHPELFGDRIVGVGLLSTSSGNLADLDFGLPELLTRVRGAVLPVAAWTMRRRPLLAERTRRIAADLVSAVTRSLSFASDVDPALARYVDAMIAGTPVEVIAEFYPAVAGLDQTAALGPLRRVPTLVLTGEHDKLIPKEHSDTLVELLRRDGDELVEYVVVPEAGHMVPLEKPDDVTRALVRLIRRSTAGRVAAS